MFVKLNNACKKVSFRVGRVGAWVHGYVGGVDQSLAWVAWVPWVHKISAWVSWVAWLEILAWVAWVA